MEAKEIPDPEKGDLLRKREYEKRKKELLGRVSELRKVKEREMEG